MIKIAEAFRGKKAFIAYLMAGDPDLPTSAAYILAAQEAGADLIEIGIPFSDPIAEGQVIQAASLRSLLGGTRLDAVLDMVASLQDKMTVPLVFMTYLNPVFVYGYERFFRRCAEIGISGIIIPDLPFDEQEEARRPATTYGIEIITRVAPTSDSRIQAMARHAQGFIYLVSSLGVTGTGQQINTDLTAVIAEIRQVSHIPVAIDFGISTPEQAATMADGVIVGSALVSIIGQHGREAQSALTEFIKSIKGTLL